MTLQTEGCEADPHHVSDYGFAIPLECKGSAQCSIWSEWLHLGTHLCQRCAQSKVECAT